MFRIALLLGFALFAFAPHALARPPAEVLARAKVHFEAGTRHYDLGAYEEAAHEFEKAYALSEHPELLYNVYSAYERAGRYAEAAAALERYLDLGEIAPDERPSLEARLGSLRARIPPPAEEPPHEEPEIVEAPADTQATPARGGLPTLAVASYGVAGGMTLAFATLAGLALSERRSLEDGCGATQSCTSGEAKRLRALSLTADVALAAGVAALTTALVSTLAGRDPKVEVSVFADREAKGLVLRRSF